MRALLLVDLQNDFLPGGALAVPGGDQVIPIANALAQRFDTVVASRDWHPPDHGSFADNHPGHQPGDVIELNGLRQDLWPVHCVQGTRGAAFSADLDQSRWTYVVDKGMDPGVDSYSAFFENGRRHSTDLHDFLRERDIQALYVMGLALDVCVEATAKDAAELGYDTYLVRDGCRAVNLKPGDDERALMALRAAGVKIIDSSEVRGG